MNPLFFMFPNNMDYFVETVLFEMDLQVEYGSEVFIEEWTILEDDDFEDDEGVLF